MADLVIIKGKRTSRTLLGELANQHHLKQYEFLDYALVFFKQTGHDPREAEISSPAEELKKLRNTLVSFIRRQEKDILLPMMDRVEETLKLQVKHIQNSGSSIHSSSKVVPSKAPPRKSAKGRLLIPPSAMKNKAELISDCHTPEAKLAFLKTKLSASGMGYQLNLSEDEFRQLFN
ncbi:MAG: BfmA/BtgA family mobilization protein [Bacteroidota bacterium]